MPSKCLLCGANIYKEGAYYYSQAGPSCPAQIEGFKRSYLTGVSMVFLLTF